MRCDLGVRAAELQPEWTDAWLSAGRVAEALGQYVDAERALSIVAVSRPESAQDWYALAQVRARIGKGREAREACAHASVRDPACDAITSVAQRLMESGDMACAEAVLSDAIDRVPDWAGAHYLRGQALESLARGVDAHTAYARASALRPSWCEAADAAARTEDRVRTLSAIG